MIWRLLQNNFWKGRRSYAALLRGCRYMQLEDTAMGYFEVFGWLNLENFVECKFEISLVLLSFLLNQKVIYYGYSQVAEYKRNKQEEDEFLRLEAQAKHFQEIEEQKERLLQDQERIQLRNELALEQKTKHLRESEKKREERLKREKKIKSQVRNQKM